jgi:division protein CdvB (Snf7/Vps24/ESCRT-III family)
VQERGAEDAKAMAPPSLPSFTGSEDKNIKDKISYAIRQVETQRKEIEQLSYRLDERRKTIFGSIVRAYEQQDDMRARVLSNEHVELQKVSRVVSASELALLHITVRLETLRDVGNVMYALTNAFKEVKRIGKSIQNLAPNLESAASEINNSFSNILAELGILTPSISLALTDTPQEIFEKAQKLISERTSELAELPKSIEQIDRSAGISILERTKRIALLASGDSSEDGENNEDNEDFKPTIMVGESISSVNRDTERAVRDYIYETGNEKIDVLDCSAQLNLPVDLVEQTYIKLLSERKLNAHSRNSS